MWPFKTSTVTRALTATTCMSGVMEFKCDGKHHMWSRWEDIEVPYALRNRVTGEWTNATKRVQERSCFACGLKQDKAIEDL